MLKIDEFGLEQYQREVLLETQEEWRESQPGLLSECQIVNFISKSKGRGRERRFPTEVELFVRGRSAYMVKDGEIKRNKHLIAPDVMANEILQHLPEEDRTVQNLLDLVVRKR